MTDLVGTICAAIFRQEGHTITYSNPGSLRAAPWLSNPVIENGFWMPDSRAEGVAGAYHLVSLRVAEGWTLRQLINSYAPPSDGNSTSEYLTHAVEWTGIGNPDQVLWELLEI